MADNTTLNTGSGGDVIATDDIAGVKYQRVKITLGADGVNDGDVASANALPVDGSGVTQPVSAASLPLPSGAATEATLLAIQGAQLPDGHNVTVDNASIAITAAALPLPAGAATEATLAAIQAAQLPDGHNVTVDNASIAVTHAALTELAAAINSNILDVNQKNVGAVDANNSSTTPLGISGTFTGTATDVSDYGSISVVVFADVASAADGLSLQWSPDGSNWDEVQNYSISAGQSEALTVQRKAQFFRVVYTNGGTGQSAFRLETILNKWAVAGSVLDLDVALGQFDPALTTRSVLSAWNGSAYGNIQATAGGNLKVSVEEFSDGVDVGIGNVGTETLRVVLANDQPTVPVSAASLPLPTGAATAANQLPDGHNVTVDNAGGASAVPIQDGGNSITVDGSVSLAAALPAGTNNIGDVDIASALPAGANAIGDVGLEPRTSGGTSIFRSLDLDETEEQVKGSAGQIYWLMAFNLTAAPLYLKIYNATAASVVVGTTTPVMTIPIPTQAATVNGAGFVLAIPHGIEFDTAITVAVTTGVADADTTGPAANGCVVNIGYA